MSVDPESWPRGYKTFFMLNSTEHKISTAQKNQQMKKFLALSVSDVVFIMLINVKISTIGKSMEKVL